MKRQICIVLMLISWIGTIACGCWIGYQIGLAEGAAAYLAKDTMLLPMGYQELIRQSKTDRFFVLSDEHIDSGIIDALATWKSHWLVGSSRNDLERALARALEYRRTYPGIYLKTENPTVQRMLREAESVLLTNDSRKGGAP